MVVCISVTCLVVVVVAIWRIYLKSCMRKCKEPANLRGKSVVLTGGTDGLGKRLIFEMIDAKVEHVLFIGRDDSKARILLEELIGHVSERLRRSSDGESIGYFSGFYGSLTKGVWSGNGIFESKKLTYYRTDISDTNQVILLSQYILDNMKKIDVLLNNAGGIYSFKTKTNQNLEYTFASNYMGHVFLTNRLMPLITKSKESRIINFSSCMHNMSLWLPKKVVIDFEDPTNDLKEYDYWYQYSISKLAINLGTKAIAHHLVSHEVSSKVVSVFPGIVLTAFNRGLPVPLRIILDRLRWLAPLVVNSVEEAVQTPLTVLFCPYDKLQQGAYYANCVPSKENKFVDSGDNVTKFWSYTKNLIMKISSNETINIDPNPSH